MSFPEYFALVVTFVSSPWSGLSGETDFFAQSLFRHYPLQDELSESVNDYPRFNEGEALTEECILQVIPGNTEDLELPLASATENCQFIFDASQWSERNKLTFITLTCSQQNDLSVTLIDHYPCVSDIDNSHPYWGNNELVDHGGNAAKGGRLLIWSLGSAMRGSRTSGGLINRRLYSGSAEGGRPPKKPNNNNTSREHYNTKLVKQTSKKSPDGDPVWLDLLVVGVAACTAIGLGLLVGYLKGRAEGAATDYLEQKIDRILKIVLKVGKKR